jgi:hypothetical protein
VRVRPRDRPGKEAGDRVPSGRARDRGGATGARPARFAELPSTHSREQGQGVGPGLLEPGALLDL